MIGPAVFLDTGFAIALLSPRDLYHAAASRIAPEIKRQRIRVVTTDAVLLEIGAALAKLAYRQAAAKVIEGVCADPNVDIVRITPEWFDAAFRLFKDSDDKEWSLTDCLSFVVMRQRGITESLAADVHFAQAGFTPLLLRI